MMAALVLLVVCDEKAGNGNFPSFIECYMGNVLMLREPRAIVLQQSRCGLFSTTAYFPVRDLCCGLTS